MNNWVEFEATNNKKFSVRPEYIVAIDGAMEENEVVLLGEVGAKSVEYSTLESYEQVKQKIMEAERADVSDVAVEHFTRDEYEILMGCLLHYITRAVLDKDECDKISTIQNKLNKILEETK